MRAAALTLSGCVVAVATFDGCVCQRGQPCSLMMAEPAHKTFPQCVCECVCASVCVCVVVHHFFFTMDEVCVRL